jgi:aryl-alcohol dehydrogenase-like predicted oxidoreductase
MEYRRLGSSGLLVSAIGLGTNNFGGRTDFDRSRAVIECALDQGITLFDTADVYGGGRSEEYIGEVLGSRRKDVVIATKFAVATGDGPYDRGASRHYIFRAVEASLRRLKTDYIDLYQVHMPDPNTPILETLQALDDLVRQGKVRYVGHSNFAAWQIVDAQWTAKTEHLAQPISTQHEYSLLNRTIQAEVLPASRAMGLGVLPYFPLAGGFLTGKYRKDAMPEGARLSGPGTNLAGRILTDPNWERVAKLEDFAEQSGHSMVELAFGWLLAEPAIGSVIAGATRPEQIDQNVKAGEEKLTADEVAALSELV